MAQLMLNFNGLESWQQLGHRWPWQFTELPYWPHGLIFWPYDSWRSNGSYPDSFVNETRLVQSIMTLLQEYLPFNITQPPHTYRLPKVTVGLGSSTGSRRKSTTILVPSVCGHADHNDNLVLSAWPFNYKPSRGLRTAENTVILPIYSPLCPWPKTKVHKINVIPWTDMRRTRVQIFYVINSPYMLST